MDEWYVGTLQTETYPDPAETNEYSDWVARNATSGFETEAARFETAPMNRTTTFDPGFILGGEGGTAGEKYWTFQESVATAKTAGMGKSPWNTRAIAVSAAVNFLIPEGS